LIYACYHSGDLLDKFLPMPETPNLSSSQNKENKKDLPDNVISTGTYETSFGEFETASLKKLKFDHIKKGDMISIQTNDVRFVIKRPEAGEKPIMTCDVDGFSTGTEIMSTGSKFVAEVGKDMRIGLNVPDQGWKEVEFPVVQSIEARRGVMDALEEKKKNQSGSGLAAMMKDYIQGDRTPWED